MARPVGILGVGQTRHGRREDVSYPDLVREAVQRVFQNCSLTPADVDAVVTGTMPSMMEGIAMTQFYFADAVQAVGKPILKTETCGSVGVSLAHTAYYWVASGMADVVLAVGHEKMFEGDSQATMVTVLEPYYQRPFLSGPPTSFSIQSQMWSSRFNIPEDKIREAATRVSLLHHNSAFDNPYAHVKVRLSRDDVMNAPVVAYPIRLYDVCPNSDGACAVIFASEDKINRFGRKAAWIKGIGYRGEEYFIGDSDKVVWRAAIEAAKEAYEMAGISNPRKELDVAEVYNPFTYQEMLFYECFGFCDFGESPDLVLNGVFDRDGELPVDPSGGVLCTNPIGATGLIRVGEAALQVLGQAGDHQIGGVKLALAHAMGGVVQLSGIMILGAEK